MLLGIGFLPGTQVEGNVVIVQYGGSFRGLKVKAAAEAGAVGTELFTLSLSTPIY